MDPRWSQGGLRRVQEGSVRRPSTNRDIHNGNLRAPLSGQNSNSTPQDTNYISFLALEYSAYWYGVSWGWAACRAEGTSREWHLVVGLLCATAGANELAAAASTKATSRFEDRVERGISHWACSAPGLEPVWRRMPPALMRRAIQKGWVESAISPGAGPAPRKVPP